MNPPTTSTTLTTTSTTSTIAPSILHHLLSRPATSTAPPPTFDDLLTRPSTSSAPPPTFDDLQLHLQPSTSSASQPPSTSPALPSPITVEEELPVVHLSDDEWEMVPVSTAHPNYWDPEMRHLVIEAVLGGAEYRLPENSTPTLPSSPKSSLGSPLPPLLPMLESPLSPLLSSSPSPVSSPPPQLPARRRLFTRLRINTAYKVKEWKRRGDHLLELTIYNHELTELYIITLPKNIRRPTKHLRLHHLFDDLYLTITKLDGKLDFTFHP